MKVPSEAGGNCGCCKAKWKVIFKVLVNPCLEGGEDGALVVEAGEHPSYAMQRAYIGEDDMSDTEEGWVSRQGLQDSCPEEEAPQPPGSLLARPGMDLQDLIQPGVSGGSGASMGRRPIPVFGRAASAAASATAKGARSGRIGGAGRSEGILAAFWQLFAAGSSASADGAMPDLPARAQSLPAHARKGSLFQRAPDVAGHQPPPDPDDYYFDFEMLPLWQLLGLACAEEPSTPSSMSAAEMQAWRWASEPPSPRSSDFSPSFSASSVGGLSPEPFGRPRAARGDEDGQPSYPKSKTVRFREAPSFEENWPPPEHGGSGNNSAAPQPAQRAQGGPILWHLLPGSH